jgi:hypothetical protein
MKFRSEDDFDDAVNGEYPFDRVCPSCHQSDPPMTVEDNSIGWVECGGAPYYHESYSFVTECCGVEPVEDLGEPEEPDPDHIDESEVA